MVSILGAENDSKQYPNTFKYLLNSRFKKKSIPNLGLLFSGDNVGSIQNLNNNNLFINSIFNTENNLKFKDYKSSNSQFLGSERTVRLLNNINSNMYK
jgi:hypothetical protein